MNYFLIRLSFDTAVHFGSAGSSSSLFDSEDHICADTLFSALCHTALDIEGENAVSELCELAKNGQLLFSDTMPWCGDDLYIPKPLIVSDIKKEIPTVQKKANKKMKWLPIRAFSDYFNWINGDVTFDARAYRSNFGVKNDVVKAAVSDGKDAVPYQIGLFNFFDNCGLYFIYAVETTEQAQWINKLTNCLGLTGVGGKVSSGYGKFHIEENIELTSTDNNQLQWLYSALIKENSSNILLTTALPTEDEIELSMENAKYRMVRRSGFVASDTYAEVPNKKSSQYFFQAGSVFASRFKGALYSVGIGGNHPVYRYSKPLFLGVEL